jgi:hypothetical protein
MDSFSNGADPPREVYRGLSEAARRIPSRRRGKSLHPATLTRWILGGVRLRDGTILRLNSRRLPGGWTVSDAAVDEFVNALTLDRRGLLAPDSLVHESAGRREKLERVVRELDGLGL